MSRRFQFRLRGLLGLAALICLLLGGWHLFETYGNYIEVGDLAVGKPIRVKGRVVRVFGPPTCWIQAVAINADGEAQGSGTAEWVERSWLCCYPFAYELDPIEKPGEWTVQTMWMPLGEDGTFVLAGSKKFKATAK